MSHPLAGRLARRTTAAVATALVALLAVSACSARDADAVAEENADGMLAEPITITDQRGVTHTFTEPIDSIVTTVIPAPSMITAIDQSYDKVDGVNESTVKRDTGSTFETMFPDSVTNVTVSGADFVPNMEEIIAIDPDVVIQWADQGDAATFIDPIEAAGYPVIGLEYGTQADLETWITMFSTLLGQEDRGEQMLETMHGTIDELAAFSAKQATKPSVLFLRAAGDGGYNAGMSSSEAYMPTWMTASGATNVGADVEYSTKNATSVEQLLEWDPEILFISSMTKLTPADVYADPALAELQAVQDKKVYAVPSGGFWWDPPSAESHLSMIWAAQLVHPESAEWDLRAEMKETYEFLYGYELSDDEIDQILRFDANEGAAGYDQFAR